MSFLARLVNLNQPLTLLLQSSLLSSVYRGYYMTERRYKIYLRVLINISWYFQTFSEDCQRCQKKMWRCFDHTPSNLSVVKGSEDHFSKNYIFTYTTDLYVIKHDLWWFTWLLTCAFLLFLSENRMEQFGRFIKNMDESVKAIQERGQVHCEKCQGCKFSMFSTMLSQR